MKTKTSFGRCLGTTIAKYRTSQVELAKRTKVAQPTISNIVSKNKSVDDSVMRALCSCWPERSDNIQLLIAGLCDVIRRWGFDPEADVEITPVDAVAVPVPTQAETDLESIRAHMSDDTVAELVHDLALILRRADTHRAHYPQPHDRAAHGAGRAAEP